MKSGSRPIAVVALAAAIAACAPARDLPPLERYPAPRGSVSPVKIGRITRPALRPASDGVVRWRTRGGPRSRLLFAVGATDRAEDVAELQVEVEAGGRSAWERRISLDRDRWFPCSVDLPSSGPVEIAIRVRPVTGAGAAPHGSD